MTSGPFQPGQAGLSIGGETIPFTMEAEVEHMTLDEAIASGLFDIPDEPGMVRIPVTMNVSIPHHILFPPGPPPEEAVADQADGVPPHADSGGAHTRFGNYPRMIAARNIARTFKTADEEASERAEFRNLLDVLHPRRDQAASQPVADAARADTGTRGAAPIKLVQLEAGETRLDPAGPERSPAEARREEAFAEASSQLSVLEPGNPHLQRLTVPGSVPDDAAVEDMQRELAAAQARAEVRSSPSNPSDLPLRSMSNKPNVES